MKQRHSVIRAAGRIGLTLVGGVSIVLGLLTILYGVLVVLGDGMFAIFDPAGTLVVGVLAVISGLAVVIVTQRTLRAR